MKLGLSPREYALKYGLSLQAVYLRIWMKQLEAVKQGRRWVIAVDSEARKERPSCAN